MPEPMSPVAPPTHVLGAGADGGCDKAVASPSGADAEGGRVREEDAERATLLAGDDAGVGPDAAVSAVVPAATLAREPALSPDQAQVPPAAGAIEFSAAWLIPGVPTYAACYGCVKMVQYALMNWLALLIAKVRSACRQQGLCRAVTPSAAPRSASPSVPRSPARSPPSWTWA